MRLVLPTGNTAQLKFAKFSPDGRFALSISEDVSFRLFDVQSGKELRDFKGHVDLIQSAEFSQDGKRILTASVDQTARIFDVITGQEISIFKGHLGKLNSAVFSPDGKTILTSSDDNTSRIFEIKSGKELKIFNNHSDAVQKAIFSPNGMLVVTASFDRTAIVHNVITGKTIQVLRGHSAGIKDVLFSKDGKILITTGYDETCRIYDVQSWELIKVLRGHKDDIMSTEISPDGKTILTSSWDRTARLFDLLTGTTMRVFESQTGWINSAVFSPDGNSILVASYDNSILIYEASTGLVKNVLKGHNGPVMSAVYSIDGKMVLSASKDQTARIFYLESSRQTLTLKGYSKNIDRAIFDPLGKVVLTVNNDEFIVQIIDLQNGNLLHDLKGHSDLIETVLFSSDGNKVITGSWDSTARIFDLKTAAVKVLFGNSGKITAAVFSPNNKYALISCDDGTARVFDISNGKIVLLVSNHTNGIVSANFSPDGKMFVTSSWDKTAHIYEFSSGQLLHKLRGHAGPLTGAKFSPDGRFVLTASWDKTARLFDVFTGKLLKIYSGHFGWVNSAVFSPNGKYILTSSNDNYARIFDLFSGKIIHILKGHKESIQSAEYNYSGELVMTYSIDRTISIYSSSTGGNLFGLNNNYSWVNSAVFSPNGKHGLIVGDNKIVFWDINTGNIIYQYMPLQNNNWLIKLPNSPFYMCSKDASKMIHYVTPSYKIIGFDQLDPVFNRPDIVLDSVSRYFGVYDRKIISGYHKFWVKRIKKLGLDTGNISKGEISMPTVDIFPKDVINENENLNITFRAIDLKCKLRRFNVFVNEVPIYGSTGASIAHLNSGKFDTTLKIPLSLGENKIQVSVLNELGLENFKYPIYINYEPTNNVIIQKTIFIGIAVNKFKNEKYNLTYCVKDINDLANEFTQKNTVLKLFINEDVTRDKIIGLKKYLLDSTTVHDKVIISCSSHGVLDESLDFYLATHDMNFNIPKLRGLKYEELEMILDSIPSRQKLLLLDACNSGENDKSEYLESEINRTTLETNNFFTNRGVVFEIQTENEAKFKKMNELFINVRNKTGSVIISAAGGRESALEAIFVDGEIIKNGAFSYSVLEYLKINKSQIEAITVNKLKLYVENRVYQITAGNQKPTSRQETMDLDWCLR